MTKINRGEVIAVVPARSGSKGVADKNIRPLAGYPLIGYSICAGMQVPQISRVIVSTDSQKYADIAMHYGADIPFLRPAAISRDDSDDLAFFIHLIEWLITNEGAAPEFLVHLRPTTPLRSPAVIEKAIDQFLTSDHTSLRSAHVMSESAYKSFEISDDRWVRMCGAGPNLDLSNFGRQQYPLTYEANGYVDIVRTDFIRQQERLHGEKVMPFITKRTYEIDEEADIELITYFAQQENELIKELFGNYAKD
jgi:CMP-N,N'-diacetyllegionaminic acid synthase